MRGAAPLGTAPKGAYSAYGCCWWEGGGCGVVLVVGCTGEGVVLGERLVGKGEGLVEEVGGLGEGGVTGGGGWGVEVGRGGVRAGG